MLQKGLAASAAAAASLLVLPAAATEDHYVTAGRYFSFVVEEGFAAATGRNQYGQLGLGDTVDRDVLTPVDIEDKSFPENDTVLAIATGAFHSLFLLDNGDAFAAGRNHYGQLGLGTAAGADPKTAPAQVTALTGVKQVAAGYAHSLFLMEDGTVMASGLNSAGQLGIGSTINKFERELKPVAFPESYNASIAKVVEIAAGYDFSYFRTETGVLYASGQNLGGQLGTNDKKSTNTPVESMTNVKTMIAGESHGLLVVDDDGIHVTGANYRGQIGGDATSAPEAAWVYRTGGAADHEYKGVKRVAAGGASSCYSRQAARVYVYCMGQDSMGQLGITGGDWNTSRDKYFSEPTVVPTDIDVIDDIALSESHGIFVNFDEVLVTGLNTYGQLGSWNGTSFGPGQTTMQKMLEFGNRGTRPTPAPSPPAVAPSPGGSPSPPATPAPSPGRDGEGDGGPDGGLRWEMLVLGAAVGLAVVLVLVGLGRNGDDEDREAGAPAATEMAAGGESQA